MKPAPPVIRNRKNPPRTDRNKGYSAPRSGESLKLLNIVFAVARVMMRTVGRRAGKGGFGVVLFGVTGVRIGGGFPGGVAVGIRVVAIRVVVVGRVGIDRIE